jgi:hypothetical protein
LGDLSHQLHDTTRLFDLALCVLAEVTCSHNEWDLWDAAFAQDLAVPEWEEVEDRSSVRLAAGEKLVALFVWDERPELASDQYLSIVEA